MRVALPLIVTVALLLGGCVTSRYKWGAYDPALYAYYKDPTRQAELETALDAIVKEAEKTGSLIPPGVYGEYGYLLLQQGKTAEATALFQKEKEHWPESAVFMDHMIQVASTRPAPAAATQ
jgi:hypothetical protein